MAAKRFTFTRITQVSHTLSNYVSTYSSKSFATNPREYKNQSDHLILLSSSRFPLEYFLATVYDYATKQLLVDISEALEEWNFTVYWPTENFISKCIEEARANFIAEPGNAFSSSMDLEIFKTCCTCNPVALSLERSIW